MLASSDSAARAAARLSRKMPRGSSVTGWRREGGQRGVGVVCFPETKRSTEGKRARAATSRLAPATHQHRAPVRARRVGVRAIAAVRIYVRVAEDPHRASLDVEPVRFERGLQDVRRSRARLEGRQGTPRLRGERARHAEGDEREAGEAEASCHLPDAARESDASARECVELELESRAREWRTTEGARVFVHRWTSEVSLFHMTCLRKKSRGSTARASRRRFSSATARARALATRGAVQGVGVVHLPMFVFLSREARRFWVVYSDSHV